MKRWWKVTHGTDPFLDDFVIWMWIIILVCAVAVVWQSFA
jgi:hypothetical protein